VPLMSMSSRQRPRCLRSSLTSVAFSRLWGLCASQMMSQRTIQGGKRARFSAGNLARFWFLPFSGRKLICTGATGINQRFAQWRHRQRHRNADPPARQNRRKKHPHCRHPPLRPTTPPHRISPKKNAPISACGKRTFRKQGLQNRAIARNAEPCRMYPYFGYTRDSQPPQVSRGGLPNHCQK